MDHYFLDTQYVVATRRNFENITRLPRSGKKRQCGEPDVMHIAYDTLTIYNAYRTNIWKVIFFARPSNVKGTGFPYFNLHEFQWIRWMEGRVDGRVEISFTNRTVLQGRMRRGALNGLVRTFRYRTIHIWTQIKIVWNGLVNQFW